MNDKKMDQLFGAAQKETPPSPEPGFENLVLSAIRRAPASTEASLFDHLGALFPRLAWTAALLIAVSVGADFFLTASAQTSLSDGIVEISEQWLFAAN